MVIRLSALVGQSSCCRLEIDRWAVHSEKRDARVEAFRLDSDRQNTGRAKLAENVTSSKDEITYIKSNQI